ncbi:MAG TPA: serine protease [Candidatus Eremiobacteraceae bacterium]|nr:serine protease [Candidatus Eremiobacteraceae bacterium]
MNAQAAVSAIAQSVVLIATYLQGGSIKTGTGFVIASTPTTAQIVTAAHVIEDGEKTEVFIGGPTGPRYFATVVRADPLRDIALLSIPVGNFTPLQFAGPDTPPSGTQVEVFGFPTLQRAAPQGASPSATQVLQVSPIPLGDLKMVNAVGDVDGEIDEGESLLFDINVTHGDSGAPIVELANGLVVATVLGEAQGYGPENWTTGDGFGLSVPAIDGFLSAPTPSPSQAPPVFHVAVHTSGDPAIALGMPALGASAGYVLDSSAGAPACVDAQGHATDNATIDAETEADSADTYDLWIEVDDCSGAPFYEYDTSGDSEDVGNMLRIAERNLLGYIDFHRAEWMALLQYGVAVDPSRNPYL